MVRQTRRRELRGGRRERCEQRGRSSRTSAEPLRAAVAVRADARAGQALVRGARRKPPRRRSSAIARSSTTPIALPRCDRGRSSEPAVSVGTVDRGLLPDPTVAVELPGSRAVARRGPSDRRRVRGAVVSVLRRAADEGDSLLSAVETLTRLEPVGPARPCVVPLDWFAGNAEFLDPIVEQIDVEVPTATTATQQLAALQLASARGHRAAARPGSC